MSNDVYVLVSNAAYNFASEIANAALAQNWVTVSPFQVGLRPLGQSVSATVAHGF